MALVKQVLLDVGARCGGARPFRAKDGKLVVNLEIKVPLGVVSPDLELDLNDLAEMLDELGLELPQVNR